MATNTSGALIVPTPSAADTNVVEAALRDIKPPVEIPDYLMWILIGLGVLLALALLSGLVVFIWALARKKLRPPAVPPPHVLAKRKLREAMSKINEPEVFTVLVSNAVRTYLEEQFQLHAPERTTEEFLHELQSSNRLADNVKTSLGEFLFRCDMVKFAKYQPTQMELEDLHNSAMRIVEETEPRPNLETAGGQSPTTQQPNSASQQK